MNRHAVVRRLQAAALGALLVLLLLASLWPAIVETAPRVRGRVVDSAGRPIAAARLVAARMLLWSHPEDELATTDAEGRFAALCPRGGRWLRAEAAGFVAQALDPERAAGGDLRFQLERAARIAGRIVDAAGAPQARTRVELIREVAPGSAPDRTMGARVITSAADGSFEFECAEGVDHVLTVGPRDLATVPVVWRGVRAGSTDLVLELSADQLAGTAVTGRLLAPDGTLVRDCSVTLLHHWSPFRPAGLRRTSWGGAFAFDRVPTGDLVCLEVRTDRADAVTFGPFVAADAAALELRLP